VQLILQTEKYVKHGLYKLLQAYLWLKFTHYFIHVEQYKQLFRGPFAFSNSISKAEKSYNTICCQFSKTMALVKVDTIKNLIADFSFPC
jgi:hypothetical protein